MGCQSKTPVDFLQATSPSWVPNQQCESSHELHIAETHKAIFS